MQTLGLKDGSFTRNLTQQGPNCLRYPYLYRLAHNACLSLRIDVCTGFHVYTSLNQQHAVKLSVANASMIFTLGYFKNGDMIDHSTNPSIIKPIFCQPTVISDSKNIVLQPHQGYRITVVGVNAIGAHELPTHTDKLLTLFDSVSPGRIAASLDNSNRMVWIDPKGTLLRVPLAHYIGYYKDKRKGNNLYLQAASAGKEEVVTVHQFFAPCMSQSIDDPKTYDSKNLASFYGKRMCQ